MAERMFTADELDYAHRQDDPTERLAARFAAREAVMKALGVGLGAFGFHDVSVGRNADTGAQILIVTARAADLAAAAGVSRWHLSLTHTDRTAVAVAVAE